jgi:hypothetical protein
LGDSHPDQRIIFDEFGSVTRNMTMLRSSEFSTRDFGSGLRFCGLRRRRVHEQAKISVTVFALFIAIDMVYRARRSTTTWSSRLLRLQGRTLSLFPCRLTGNGWIDAETNKQVTTYARRTGGIGCLTKHWRF